MHLIFTLFGTYYIFNTRIRRSIIYLQSPPDLLAFKHAKERGYG